MRRKESGGHGRVGCPLIEEHVVAKKKFSPLLFTFFIHFIYIFIFLFLFLSFCIYCTGSLSSEYQSEARSYPPLCNSNIKETWQPSEQLHSSFKKKKIKKKKLINLDTNVLDFVL